MHYMEAQAGHGEKQGKPLFWHILVMPELNAAWMASRKMGHKRNWIILCTNH